MLDVRGDFPLLLRQLNGKPIGYFDSAATTLKPRQVLDAERAYSEQFTANVHRGRHALSEEASAAYESARQRAARFIGTRSPSVIFTRNTTESLNIVAAGLGLQSSDCVLASVSEHHSNLVPWMNRAKTVVFERDPLRPMTPEFLASLIDQHRPRVLALGWVSNVTGVIEPVAELCKVAKERGVVTVVDAAQAVGHLPIDVEEIGCDFLAFSGHKMLGPTGIGVLYGTPERLESLEPVYFGGGTVDRVTTTGFTRKESPYRFEAGTPNISGALGLSAAMDYLERIGFDALAEHEASLTRALTQALSGLPKTRIIQAEGPTRIGVANIVSESPALSPESLAVLLSDRYQLMLRSGFHCAHPLFDFLRVNHGTVRASVYLYNTVDEVERLGAALREAFGKVA
jgi:cysteine desulfurase/selenocysteine lyase